MKIDLVGVLQDGSLPSLGVPTNPRKTLSMPLQSNATLSVRVLRQNGAVVTGGSLTWTVKKKPTDMQPAFQKTSTCTDPTSFEVTPFDTKLLPAGLYVYDVWYTDVSGKRDSVVPLSPMYFEAVATKLYNT